MHSAPENLDGHLLDELGARPGGLTADHLWRRCVSAGIPVTRALIAERLLDLQGSGAIRTARRRWYGGIGIASEDPPGGPELIAVPVQVQPGMVLPPPAPFGKDAGAGTLPASAELLRRLLPHYSECLRRAGGSRLAQVPERHGRQYLFLRPDRAWWPEAETGCRLRMDAAAVPPGLLESLYARRGEQVLLGYPLSLFTHEGATFLRPVGVLPAAWRIEANGDLVLEARTVEPYLNPDWVAGLRRNRLKARVLAWLAQAGRVDDGLASAAHGDWRDVPEMARTLESFLAGECRSRLNPRKVDPSLQLGLGGGLYNVLGLYLPEANRYTGGARRDLEELATWDEERIAGTALGALFGAVAALPTDDVPVLPPLPVGEDQLVATREGLSERLTVVTGPPGTGKSQVVVALMISAALAGRSVLFATRTHQAIDAVEERLRNLHPGRPLLARARAADGQQEFNFARALDALLARGGATGARDRLAAQMDRAKPAGQTVWRLLDAADRLTAATDALAQVQHEVRTSDQPGLEHAADAASRGWWHRLLQGRRVPAGRNSSQRPAISLDRRPDAERVHRACVAELKRLQEERPLERAIADLQEAGYRLLGPLADALAELTSGEREKLAALRGDLGLAAGAGDQRAPVNRRIWQGNADLVLTHFPLWAVTTLGAANRLPLLPALFDYVVIDEATTCDIASALPLLARGKRAVIVGDKMQTAMVVDLDPGREREMLVQAGLDRPGIGRFAFTQASLFDLAASAPHASHHLLRDHFRCHADIATFVSDQFYDGQLAVVTDEGRLRPPPGQRPGLHWTHVEGPIQRAGTGCLAEAEARAIADHLHTLLENDGYDGTVGVVTPFARQAERIVRLCDDRISFAARERAQLRIATSHAFQGDARDVILISPCFGPDTPAGAAWFLTQGGELVNVAVSRARAVCHVFGNRDAILTSGIPHLAALARRTEAKQPARAGDERFESPWEKRLYDALVARGLEPIPQYPLAGRRLDLALIRGAVRLDIEVDGESVHRDASGSRKVSDLWRDHQVRGLGWRVVRFWVYQLRDEMELCVERVIRELEPT